MILALALLAALLLVVLLVRAWAYRTETPAERALRAADTPKAPRRAGRRYH